MNAKLILLCAIAVAAAPLAFAHSPAGTPKNYCEDQSSGEWQVHDYGPVASGRLIYGNEDGNLGGDCEPGFTVTPSAVPCPDNQWSFGVDEEPVPATYVCVNPPVADWDGHNEFAFGGAWLLANSGAGVPQPPNVPAGTLYCFGAEGHHPNFGPFTVEDLLLAGSPAILANTIFLVASDTADISGTGEGCGDFQSDESWGCLTSCDVTFPPGLDGAYVAYVEGTLGHIRTDVSVGCDTHTHDYFLTVGDSTFEPERHQACNRLQIDNTGGTGDVTVTFYPSLRQCSVAGGASDTCIWRRDRWFVITNTDAAANDASGSWTQTA